MITVLCAVVASGLLWPASTPWIITGLLVGTILTARKYGFSRLFGLAPLLDLLLVSPYVLWLFHSVVDPQLNDCLLPSLPANPPALAASVTLNTAGAGLMTFLLTRRALPEDWLPLRGMWARKMLASIALALSIANVAPLIWSGQPTGAFAPHPPFTALAGLTVMFGLAIGYLAPLWLTLVYGWSILKGAPPP